MRQHYVHPTITESYNPTGMTSHGQSFNQFHWSRTLNSLLIFLPQEADTQPFCPTENTPVGRGNVTFCGVLGIMSICNAVGGSSPLKISLLFVQQ